MESKRNTKKKEYKKRYRILQLSLADEISHGICVSNLAYQISKELNLEENISAMKWQLLEWYMISESWN